MSDSESGERYESYPISDKKTFVNIFTLHNENRKGEYYYLYLYSKIDNIPRNGQLHLLNTEKENLKFQK